MDVSYGKAFKKRREERGLSLRATAEAVGISASHLSRIEAEESDVSLSIASALAAALDASLDDIVGIGKKAKGRSKPPIDTDEVERLLRLALDEVMRAKGKGTG